MGVRQIPRPPAAEASGASPASESSQHGRQSHAPGLGCDSSTRAGACRRRAQQYYLRPRLPSAPILQVSSDRATRSRHAGARRSTTSAPSSGAR